MRLNILVIASTWIATSLAIDWPFCYTACSTCLKRVHFVERGGETGGGGEEGGRNNVTGEEVPGSLESCSNVKSLTSLYLCLHLRCNEQDRGTGLIIFNETCVTRSNVSIPGVELIDGYTTEQIANLRRFELEEADNGLFVDEVVLPSDTYYGLWEGTMDSVSYVNWHHYAYGLAMVIFWSVVVAIGMLSHLINNITRLFPSLSKNPSALSNSFSWLAWLRNSMATPATFTSRCSESFAWGTVPPRLQSLTLLAFLFINIVFSIHGYRIFPGNQYFKDTFHQGLRYVSDRTGIISFANFPIIWLFGMRNNILLWLTGWDFGTYNSFHRWVARIATVQAIIHSVGYTWLILREGGWDYFASWWAMWFWWAGELATVIMSLLLGLSIYWLRRRHYEFFLITHIIMSMLTLLFMLGHVSIFNGRFDALVNIPVAIWILDRVFRFLRILAFNPYHPWSTIAHTCYSSSSHMIRLVIPWSTSLYRPRPGTYYYIHVLDGARFWESHPFTAADITDGKEMAGKTIGEQVPLLDSAENDMNVEAEEDKQGMNLTFFIRPYDSFTSRLSKAPSRVRVLVDGPYGHTRPLHTFDNVLFIVGGSGIVVPASYLSLLTSSKMSKSTSTSGNATQVQIHWSLREPAFTQSILSNLPSLQEPNVSLSLYITSSSSPSPFSQPSQLPGHVSLQRGRIDARSVIERMCSENDQSVAVVACGPSQMADEARRAVVDVLKSGRKRLEYFEESFQC